MKSATPAGRGWQADADLYRPVTAFRGRGTGLTAQDLASFSSQPDENMGADT